MSRAFNLTAELNLRGPSNVRLIVADIRRQLGSITADVDVRVNPATSRNLGALNSTLANLNQTLTRTQTNANAVTAAFNNMGRAIGAFNTNVNNSARNVQNLTAATNNLNTNLTRTNRQARQAGNEFEEFGRQSALAVRRFAAFATVTSVIFKFTNAISGATQEFISFNKELVRVAQVTDSALKDLSPLVNEITRLSTSLGVTSQDLIAVSSTLAQAGLSARDTERALKALALSALAPSFDDLNETVEGSIALMRQFGISASGLEDALGSVNAVAAKFAVEASDLITAIQRTGGVFATASRGVSEGKDALNEFLAVFTSIRQTTRESAETIATGLRTIFTRIQRQSTIDALQALGIELRNAQGQFVGAFEAVRRLSQGLSKIDPRSREFAAISEELGGFRQIGKVIPLIQQFAVAQEALKVAQQGQGSLARDAATAQQSVANQITKVREEFNALVRSIGQSDSFQTFVKLSLDLASALIKLADSAKSVLPALTAIAAIRGASAIGSFATGFAGGLRRQNSGGYIRRFASGGLVPGSGNTDTVPAMLTPGEFVIRKNAVRTIGLDSLQSMNRYADGGIVQQLAKRSTLGIRKGARSKFKELSEDEISRLSTPDLIKYAKAQARDIFTTGGAGMVTGMKFIPVPTRKITPELEPHLETYLGKKGFWREQISPFGRPDKNIDKAKKKMSREDALKKQESRMADEVAARSQQWQNIRSGSAIDNYLLSSLKDPILTDYRSVRGGGTLAKPFHNTRLRKAVNDALEAYDDFDYSPGNIDKLVSTFAAKNFANGGGVQRFNEGKEVLGKRERRIQAGYTGKDGSLRFGLVGLRSGLSDEESLPTSLQEPLMTPKKRSVQLEVGTLSNSYKNQFSQEIESTLQNSFSQTVQNLASQFASKIGAKQIQNEEKINKVLKGAGFTSVVGSALESALGLIGAPYVDKTETTKALDFPYGLGKASQLFGDGFPSRVPTDVTRTIGGFGKGRTQILNQIDRFIDATEAGEFTKAFQEKVSGTKATTLSPMLSGIMGRLGSKSVKDLAQPGVASSLIAKYGLARGGLGKNSLQSSLQKLPSDQQQAFLNDLDKVVTTGRFANGGSVEDTVPALLTPGEFVINKKAASRIGSSKLHQLNRADRIQGFNKGGSVGGVQKFITGGGVIESTLAGMSAKDNARLTASIRKNADAFEQLERMVAGWPADDIAMAMKKLDRSLEKGSNTADALAASVSAGIGGGGATRTPKKGVLQQTAGVAESRAVTAPVGPSGFAASQARINQISGNVQQYQRGQDVVDRRDNNGSTVNMSNAGLQFAASLKNATTPLQQLTQAAKNAGGGLVSLGKSAIGATGRGASNLVSSLGGGVLNSLGLGRFSSRGGAGAAGAAGGGGIGSRMSGMGGMIATMAGGTIIDSLSKATGGEKTDTGRTISAVGSNMLNYGAMGAAIGGPWGAAAGAAIGLAAGLMEAKKAGEEYAQAQLESKAQIATEKSAQAVEAFAADPNKAGTRASAFAALTEATAAEDAAMNNKQLQKVGFLGKAANFLTMGAAGYRDQTTAELAESNMKGQEEGAKQAKQLLAAEMTRTGKTFAEISKSMKPDELKMLTNNIAQADKTYVYFQTQRAQEIKRLKEQAKNAEDPAQRAAIEAQIIALEQDTIKQQDVMSKAIAARSAKELDAAVMADRAAKANAALGIALERATMTLEKTFTAMAQGLSALDMSLQEAARSTEQIVSGKAALTGTGFSRDADILKNPDRYSEAQREGAMNRSAAMLGSQGNLAVRTAQFSGRVGDEASRLVANAPAGEDQTVTAQRLESTLIARIKETFGADTSLGRTLSANVRNIIQKKIADAEKEGEAIDFNELVESALGPLNKASDQASNLLIEANEKLAKSFEQLGATAQAIADLQQQQADRTASLIEMQANSRMGQKEALGMRVGLQERINLRMNSAARGTGLAGNQLTAANLVNRRAQLEQRQKDLQDRQAATEPMAATSPFARQQLFKFQQELAKVNGELANTDKALENLPQALEGAISDVTAEMSKRVGELEARKEAGAGYAEKLVTSTPQELQALSNTFNLLNNTLRGNITTIQNSRVAQQAYVTSLQQGKTQQEALADAQSAFAAENKNALGMFNELAQISGVKGPEIDRMRADLLENFAKAQGAGLERSPMFQKILSQLRTDPAQRAASDPVLKALQTQAENLRAQQAAATAALNAKNEQQMRLLEATGAKLVKDINDAKLQVEIAVRNIANRTGQEVPVAMRSKGGIIYASNGTLARGTDTVPAMLTPGEFVVNAKATRQNLPLLQSINRSKGGRVRYFAEGGLNDISGVGAQTARNTQINTMKENNRVQNNILSGVKNLGQKSESIKNDTSYATNNQLPNLSDVTYDSKELNSQNFGYLIGLTERIYGFTQGIPSFMSDMTGNIGALLSLGSDISNGVLAGLALLMQGRAGGLPNNQQAAVGRAGNVAVDMLGELFGNMFSRGGPVYASKGKLINFEPKGTDTVPAMLTPGEFVINRQATQKNLPLLQAINNGIGGYSSGGIVYLQRGGQAISPVRKQKPMSDEDLEIYLNRLKSSKEIADWIRNNFSAEALNKIIEKNKLLRRPGIIIGGKIGGKILPRLFPGIGPAVGAISGGYDAYKKGENIFKGALLSALTGDATSGSIASGLFGIEAGSVADKTMGVIGAMINGALTGGAAGAMGGITALPAAILGAFVGGATEFFKIYSEKQLANQKILKERKEDFDRAVFELGLPPRRPFTDDNNTPKSLPFVFERAVSSRFLSNRPSDAYKVYDTKGVFRGYDRNEDSIIDDTGEKFDDRKYREDLKKNPATIFQSSGGLIYASKGKLINFEPKGTDTVPAMLTPGEFVVNRQATQKNLPLLQAINGGVKGYSRGGTVYLADGGGVSLAEDVANKNLWSVNDFFDQLQQKEHAFISNPSSRFKIYSKQKQLIDLSNISRISPLSLISRVLRDSTFGAAVYRPEQDGGGQEYKIIKTHDPKSSPLNPNGMNTLRTKFLKRELFLGRQAVSGKKPANTYEGAAIDEARRYPQIMEYTNSDAFTEQLPPAEVQKLFFDRLLTEDQKKNAASVLSDRFNYLTRIVSNNEKAATAFAKEPSNTKERDLARRIVQKQLDSSRVERALVQFIRKKDIFKGIEAPPNRFENNLFDVDTVPSSLAEILARPFNRGGVAYANRGQLINFQPRGSDTVPAMLTPGEFVVNKNATQKNLPLLQGINSGQVSYLANGTPGLDMFEASMKTLTQTINTGAKQLNTAFLEAVQQLTLNTNNRPAASPTPINTINGVSNNTAANIDLLGSRLDRFIEQLQAALPPVIKVEGQHDVNVVINGAAALQNLLQGPISSLIQTAIQSAFNAKSRANEGA